MDKKLSDLFYIAFLKDGLPIFEMDLAEEMKKHDSLLLSGFVSAISSFTKAFSNGDLKVIDQGDRKIVFEQGMIASVISLVSNVSEELHTKLRDILATFESKYRDVLQKNSTYDSLLFEDFKKYVNQIFLENSTSHDEKSDRSDNEGTSEKTNILVVCPICSEKKAIEIPTIRGVKLIEHAVKKGDVCEHSFTVYVDSKFEIKGYGVPEIEMDDLKAQLLKIKSPYDD